jgi:hypothetical protein
MGQEGGLADIELAVGVNGVLDHGFDIVFDADVGDGSRTFATCSMISRHVVVVR